MTLTAGTKLGPYEILSPLGAGGMGEVYRARDTRLERTVAIKILPDHLSGSVEARQRFDREARAVSGLSHPNVCQLYDVGQQDGIDYLVMEYLEGETLAERIGKGPLSQDQVLKYGIEICEGLEMAHRSGVVHRDLKPGNIMLTKSGAKLMDFGLAKPTSDGKRVALDQTDTDGRHYNVWIRDLNSSLATRLGFGPWLEQITIWRPDGRQVVYTSNEKLYFSLYIRNADGSGTSQSFLDFGTPQQGPWDWSRDGKYVLVRNERELWYATMPDRQTHLLLRSPSLIRNAQFSPDGKFVAYASSETGSWEVYVSPFPGFGSRWQVSRGEGGEEPRWRRDGKELFFLAPDGRLMAADVKIGDGFEAGLPVALFQTHPRQAISAMDFFSYDVTADGARFLVNTRVDNSNSAPLSVVLNWSSEVVK